MLPPILSELSSKFSKVQTMVDCSFFFSCGFSSLFTPGEFLDHFKAAFKKLHGVSLHYTV